jgi:hypothetical protein
MECWKNDVPDSSKISASVVNGEESRRPAGLPIRVREMDCVLAAIQAQIEMLLREKTYLRLVRGELAGRKPSKGVLHPAPPHRRSRLLAGSLGVQKTGGPPG